eukprot:2441462-Rhodomonas_salina.1
MGDSTAAVLRKHRARQTCLSVSPPTNRTRQVESHLSVSALRRATMTVCCEIIQGPLHLPSSTNTVRALSCAQNYARGREMPRLACMGSTGITPSICSIASCMCWGASMLSLGSAIQKHTSVRVQKQKSRRVCGCECCRCVLWSHRSRCPQSQSGHWRPAWSPDPKTRCGSRGAGGTARGLPLPC